MDVLTVPVSQRFSKKSTKLNHSAGSVFLKVNPMKVNMYRVPLGRRGMIIWVWPIPLLDSKAFPMSRETVYAFKARFLHCAIIYFLHYLDRSISSIETLAKGIDRQEQ